jgi:RNA polymerase sigma-70 factor (ECF subfamily)
MDDLQAVRLLKGGDVSGLEALVARYQAKAIRTAFLITHDEALAEDVVQETFVRIYQRIRQFDDSRPFAPYLMRSIVNAAINATKYSVRRNPAAGMDLRAVEELVSHAGPLEDRAEYGQLKHEIHAALAQLPQQQRAVIVQRYYLEMSEKEMAETLKTPPGTVKWLLHAARRRLRLLLGTERSAE